CHKNFRKDRERSQNNKIRHVMNNPSNAIPMNFLPPTLSYIQFQHLIETKNIPLLQNLIAQRLPMFVNEITFDDIQEMIELGDVNLVHFCLQCQPFRSLVIHHAYATLQMAVNRNHLAMLQILMLPEMGAIFILILPHLATLAATYQHYD